jgi:hypothetical protein
MRLPSSISLAVVVLVVSPVVRAAVRSVGPSGAYPKPCAAFAAAADGDVVEIDAAGKYDGDVCAIARSNLTIRGKGGRAKIDAAGKSYGGKAIWVVQGNDTVIEDVELSGCAVPDKNGAGIRQEGRNLTLRRVFFHDNEDGVLTGANAESTIVIEDSEFARNGAGDGYSHNMYIGEVKSFTLRGSYSHHAKVGHLVKSRALENRILYNRLTDEDGTASYELDLPQGGKSFVVGNVLQQSAATQNGSFVSFARESKRNPGTALFLVHNTFFNARSAGTFVAVAPDAASSVTIRNNVFAGPGAVCDQAAALLEANFVGDARFANAAVHDYRLAAGSPAIDKAAVPGMGASESLAPSCQYAHPAHAVVRVVVGSLDQGAFELGGETSMPCGSVAPAPDAGVGIDAGTRDAAVGTDSGSRAPDADAGDGIGAGDAPVDAGASGGGAAPPGDEGGGCSCALPRRSGHPWSSAALLGFALAARQRRRSDGRASDR